MGHRRPRVIPSPLLDAGRTIDFAPLEELTGEVAILLWRTLRSITLWTQTCPDEHRHLSNVAVYRDRRAQIHATEIEPAIVPALLTATEIFDPGSDPTADALQMLTCRSPPGRQRLTQAERPSDRPVATGRVLQVPSLASAATRSGFHHRRVVCHTLTLLAYPRPTCRPSGWADLHGICRELRRKSCLEHPGNVANT